MPVKPILADASAILAFLNFERGGETVAEQIENIAVTSVNLAEIVTVLMLRGIKKDWIDTRVHRVFTNVVPFDREQAQLAGQLAILTQKHGLSLGDRACLAAGIVLDARVLTADTAWRKLNLGVEIVLIR